MMRAATDVGGTFTDFAAFDDARRQLVIAKSSTRQLIVEAIKDCFAKAGVKPAELTYFAHGNTLAINIVIEKKGARTGLLTTAGFRDILEIARGNIRNAFDLMFDTPAPLVPRELRKEVSERIITGGKIQKPLDMVQAQSAIQSLVDENCESIGICLLHSYANPTHEQALKELAERHGAKMFVTASSDLLRQYREFERSSTTVLNAYVGPRCGRFYDDLREFLASSSFQGNAVVMQSSGGTMTIETAKRQPVRTMESGPVGGTIAAAYVGRDAGFDSVVAFDMGGTTAKVSIVRDGRIEIADGYTIGPPDMGYPMQLPVVDILEVGSGGGSIAQLDETGLLKVGPVSAGADPGPACYGCGGDQPTVTDADVVLGRLNPDFFLGGEIKLDVAAAAAAIETSVARPLKLGTTEAASGIVRVTDADMAHAVRIMTVQKGHDPRDFVLVAYGGAGPAHAIAIARELGIRQVVIPPHPGIFSAIGMLLADAREDNVLSYVEALDKIDLAALDAHFSEIESQGIKKMHEAEFEPKDIIASRSVEMRYVGQEFTLIVPLLQPLVTVEALAALGEQFDALHDARYGHAFKGARAEIVSLRSQIFGMPAKPDLTVMTPAQTTNTGPIGTRSVYFTEAGFVECAVYRRNEMGQNAQIVGPAVVEEVMSCTILHPGDRCRVDGMGNLHIDVVAAR